VIELALATGTAPRDWWWETPETIATAAALLNERARRARAERGKRR
jgi:hypothetical protein